MKALITGITSQDGSYLAEHLLSRGYEVIGLVRPGPLHDANIKHLLDSITIKESSLTNLAFIQSVLRQVKPDEVYNLAAVSNFALYIKDPVGSHDINGNAALVMLEAIRTTNSAIRFFQAGTCQMFGTPITSPQSEQTPYTPVTPYAASKAFAQWMVAQYRTQHKLHASSGILFSHESPRRPPDFVTRKITQAVAKISLGIADELVLGNLDVKRDWGFAGDYVEAMWMINRAKTPDDYVIGSGKSHTVREFLHEAFTAAGITEYERFIKADPALMRTETAVLEADITKIQENLGWRPKTSFKELVRMMVMHDIALLRESL
ncbi:GDP-mannose 4,6-dehydratase [Candidatus Woesearchaeota archaeon]|nr:GDP-mannose 4,6-dehydratase [Candidatus Woesearchaeota archaeon]